MVFDLRRALLAKEERESARLMDFEFRLRARTLRLLAIQLDRDPDAFARMTAQGSDDALVDALQRDFAGCDIAGLFADARAEARRQLVQERGDPAPYQLG